MFKRIVPLLLAAGFPCGFWLAVGMMGGTEPPPVNPLLLIGLFWLLDLACAVVVFWQAVRGKWEGRSLALANMTVKLLHIGHYVTMFLFAISGALLLFLFPMLAAIAFVVDVMTITLSGIVGLSGVVRCRMEGRLTTGAAIVNGILQFMFCVDVFSAVWVFYKSGKREEILS